MLRELDAATLESLLATTPNASLAPGVISEG